jgi:endonuclease G, mitochondrial
MAGYDPHFLDGIHLPLPEFTNRLNGQVVDTTELREGIYADYINYTVITNGQFRAPVLVALNIDQRQIKDTKRTNKWIQDWRIGTEFQLSNEYYKDNLWDRGHMARRASASWGPSLREAQRASDETFYYSNACLQHANLNQDEWLALEDWVLELELDEDGLLTEYSGPIFGDFGRSVMPSGMEPAIVPSGFFKIVCFKNKTTKALDVRAFIMYQDEEALKDKNGKKVFNNQAYQVTVTEIERLTGLVFADDVYKNNPLFFSPANADEALNVVLTPERIEVSGYKEITANTPRITVLDDFVEVYITAAMINPEGRDTENEWISIANFTEAVVDLTDWEVGTLHSKRFPLSTFTQTGLQLNPGESLRVMTGSAFQMSNDAGVIFLWDMNGARIDRVNYTKGMVKPGKVLMFLSPKDIVRNRIAN